MVQVIMAYCVLHNIGISGGSAENLENFNQVAVQQKAIANHDQVAAGLKQPLAAGTWKRREDSGRSGDYIDNEPPKKDVIPSPPQMHTWYNC